jgi:hypothetical protein
MGNGLHTAMNCQWGERKMVPVSIMALNTAFCEGNSDPRMGPRLISRIGRHAIDVILVSLSIGMIAALPILYFRRQRKSTQRSGWR